MTPETLPDQKLAEIANMLKALSEPSRLKVMQHVHKKEMSVTELAELVGTSQANISKHLKILQLVNLVKKRRDGNHIYYSVYDDCVHKMCDAICEGYFKILEKHLQQIA